MKASKSNCWVWPRQSGGDGAGRALRWRGRFARLIASAWFAIAAPPGTPAAIANKLNTAIVDIMKLQEVRDKFAVQGAEVVGGTSAEMTSFMNAERARWKKLIEGANVKID